MLALPHEFSDPLLLEQALTHSSHSGAADNERMEFLGDAALDLVVAEELFHHHADLPEGELTELKASVVSRKSLAHAASRLDLESRARVGPGLARRALPRSVLANLYEAVLGAVYLDAGLEAARSFARGTLDLELTEARQRSGSAVPKQAFQEVCQKHWGEPPAYVLVERRGEAHSRAFLVRAEAGGESFPSAWGRTLKEAESWAAHEALLVLDDEKITGDRERHA